MRDDAVLGRALPLIQCQITRKWYKIEQYLQLPTIVLVLMGTDNAPDNAPPGAIETSS